MNIKNFFSTILISLFLSHQAFGANECSGSEIYNKLCGSLDIIPSYECVLNNKDLISNVCIKKASDLLSYCPMNDLKTCATVENDKDNLFELCLSQSKNSECSEVGKKYS